MKQTNQFTWIFILVGSLLILSTVLEGVLGIGKVKLRKKEGSELHRFSSLDYATHESVSSNKGNKEEQKTKSEKDMLHQRHEKVWSEVQRRFKEMIQLPHPSEYQFDESVQTVFEQPSKKDDDDTTSSSDDLCKGRIRQTTLWFYHLYNNSIFCFRI
jgi:hypothetical protein